LLEPGRVLARRGKLAGASVSVNPVTQSAGVTELRSRA
jgi:hypothetical protein